MKTTYHPTAELLESRDLMAFSILQTGNLLKLTGSNGADVATMKDLGNQSIMVTQNNTDQIYRNVRNIQVDAGAGSDKLQFEVSSQSPVLDLNIKLADGNDLFFGMMNGTSALPRSYRIRVDGGNGSDNILLYDTKGGKDVLEFEARGGAGNDVIWAFTSEMIKAKYQLMGETGDDDILFDALTTAAYGSMVANIDGGTGNDEIHAAIHGYASFFEMPYDHVVNRGSMKLTVQGGSGNDKIQFLGGTYQYAEGFTNQGTIDVQLSGGEGSDTILGSMGEFAQNAVTIVNRGTINFRADGGAGNDIIEVGSAVNNYGTLRGRVAGGAGVDTLAFYAWNYQKSSDTALVESDLLDDLILVTTLVQVRNARADRIEYVL